MVLEGESTWDGEQTIQYTDNVLQNCTPETYIILLTDVIPINSIKKEKITGDFTMGYCYYNGINQSWFYL